jgi:hypothetical protein
LHAYSGVMTGKRMRVTSAVVGGVMAIGAWLLLGASLPAAAAAECGGQALPPENSQIDQYLESIPGDCGNSGVSRDPGGGGRNGGGDGSSQVAPGTVDQLEGLGPEGQATAELAVANAPEPAGDGANSGDGSGDGADSAGAEGADGTSGRDAAAAAGAVAGQAEGDSSPFEALASAIGGGPDDDGGMGFALPLLLALTAGIGIGYLVWRRSRESG